MTPDSHALRKAKVYEAALTLTAQGISPAAMTIQQLAEQRHCVRIFCLEGGDLAGAGPLLL